MSKAGARPTKQVHCRSGKPGFVSRYFTTAGSLV